MIAQLLRPWRTTCTWWTLVHLTTGLITAGVLFTVSVTLLSTAASLIVIVPIGVALVWITLVVNRWLVRLDRSRFAVLLDVELVERSTAPALPPGASRWSRMKATMLDADRWREVAWSMVHFPVAVVFGVVAPSVWSASVAALTYPAWILALRDDDARLGWLTDADLESGLVGLTGLVGLLVVAPWLTQAMGRGDEVMARWLLGRTREAELEAELDALSTSRAAAVDSAEAERRRIERDLHDGAQQRLIAVAMDLGLARDKMASDPDRAAEYVASAHEDVKAAMRELRDLVRGIHPVILEDRGLDAALSAVVARAAVPVALRVDVAQRPPAAVESAAYFIVSEALVNVDRHARATRASVEIARVADRLTIAVTDDGVGGAAPVAAPVDPTQPGGTGLAGLAERVAGLGGWMRVISPAGGPTSIIVELPCES